MPNAAPNPIEVQQDQGVAPASQPPLSQPSASAAEEASSRSGIANANGWQPIETAPLGGGNAPFLVTNNLNSRDAHGHMSHLWLVRMIHEDGDGGFCAFAEDDRKIHFLTYWQPIAPPVQP